MGTTDWEIANQVFEGIAWAGSTDIFSDNDTVYLSYDSKNVNVGSVQQKQKCQAFTYCNTFPNSKQGKITGLYRVIKCKIDTGPEANLTSLGDYKKVNPSEFDESGILLQGTAMTEQL